MGEADSTNSASPPERPWFQFSLGTMFLVFIVAASSLAVFGAWGVLAFLLVLGSAAFDNLDRPSLRLQPFSFALVIMCLLALLFPIGDSVHEAGRRNACRNNLKKIATALADYRWAHGSFPPAYVADSEGNPMLSWRVLILPYIDRDDLYKKYNLQEPWEGPTNKSLSAAIIHLFMCPSDPNSFASCPNRTNYLAVVGPNSAWSGGKPRKPSDSAAEAANTILLVEVANSGIAWAEPRDLSIDAIKSAGSGSSALVPSSGHGPRSTFFLTYDPTPCVFAAMADGSVRCLPRELLSRGCLPKLLEIGGCKGLQLDNYDDPYERHSRLNWPNIAALGVWVVSVAALLRRAVRSRKPRPVEIAAAGE